MVVDVKVLSSQHKKLFHCNNDMLVVSFNFVPKSGYPLRVGELVVDARCDLPLLEP